MQARVRPFVVLLSGTVVAFAVYAALAWVAHSTQPKLPGQGLERRPFIVSRDPDNPLIVRRGAPHVVPQLYADTRLTCSVELPADYDLDIVVRRVEPVIGDRGRFEAHHGRFVVLRLSGTAGDLGALGDGAGFSGPELRRCSSISRLRGCRCARGNKRPSLSRRGGGP